VDRHGRVLRGAAWSGEVRQGYLIKIMSGITTSETLAGEQPKDDNLGGRVDELTAEVGELRKEVVRLRCRIDDKFGELEKKIDGRQT